MAKRNLERELDVLKGQVAALAAELAALARERPYEPERRCRCHPHSNFLDDVEAWMI